MVSLSFTRKGNLKDNSYFLANNNCFFHRFADSGFRNKWTGFWSDEIKFLEYFSIKVNGEFLSPKNCKIFEYTGAKAVHEYFLKGNSVKESIFIPKTGNVFIVELVSRKDIPIELELAVNIRRRNENKTSRKYQIKTTEKGFLVANSLGKFEFRLLEGRMDFRRNLVYKTHYPSGEEQSCMIPGSFTASGKRIVFAVSAGRTHATDYAKELREKEVLYSKLIKGKIASDNETLMKGFSWSILGIELLRKKFGTASCFYAGLSWFQQFWGRDLFWITQSLLSLGYFKDVKNCLEIFAQKMDKGRIPNFISFKEKSSWNSIDSSLLWLISLESYVLSSGDIGFLREMKSNVVKVVNYLFSRDSDNDGFIEHDQETSETWMDTLRRGEKAVEVQALYFKSLCAIENLFSLLNRKKPSRKIQEIPESLNVKIMMVGNSFEGAFYDNGFYADRIANGNRVNIRTANAVMPILCGLGKHSEEILNAIESKIFTTSKGVRTRAEGEHDYFPWDYHSGMVWSLTTAWVSAAEFVSRRTERGWKYLLMLIDDIERDSLGCVGECWDASDLSLRGCSLQLWGSGFIIKLVDEFMLGIRIDAGTKTIRVSPQLPLDINFIEREIFVGKGKIKLIFKKTAKGVSVSCNNKSIKIINLNR